MELTRYTPNFLDSFFDTTIPFGGCGSRSSAPALNVHESASAYKVELAASGLKKEDFAIEIEEGCLSISSQRAHESNTAHKDDTLQHEEFNFMSFARRVQLPKGKIDEKHITAAYTEGILCITVPKREEEIAKTRTIPIE